FYQVSAYELRKLFIKIKAGDWDSIEKPFISQILLKVTQSDDYKEFHKLEEKIYEVKDLTKSLEQKSEIQMEEIAAIKNLITNLTNRLAEKNI
ncbi:2031_t:CDS:1, partial [Gigaspora rosea]